MSASPNPVSQGPFALRASPFDFNIIGFRGRFSSA